VTPRPPDGETRTRPRAEARPTAPARPRGEPAHPRIRARRVEVARHAGRRRLRRLNVLLALVAAVVWALVVVRSPLLDVDRVQVSGARRLPASDVVAASGVRTGASMAELDLGRARDAVAALPWADEVRVRRMWPGTVRIVVTERRAAAAVAHPGGWARLDATGRVLDVVAGRPDSVVVLAGTRDAAPGATLGPRDRNLLRAVDRLPSALAATVAEAGRGSDGLELTLDDGYVVVLGDATDVAAKAEAATAVHQVAEEGAGCRIDVRVPSAPVLTRGGTCA